MCSQKRGENDNLFKGEQSILMDLLLILEI